MMDNRTILHGDVLKVIKEMPDESVDVCITSPPYYQLRSYQAEGQIGLEKSIPEYIDKMMEVVAECRRVLKGSGTMWWNVGDTYAGSNNGQGDTSKYHRQRFAYEKSNSTPAGIRAKSLMGIPERLMIRCIDSGLILRNKIPWVKNNTLPCPYKDRFQNRWESIFFFSKEGKYYTNLDAVRVPEVRGYAGHIKGTLNDNNHFKYKTYPKNRKQTTLTKQNFTPGADGKPKPTVAGFNERWRAGRLRKAANHPGQSPQTISASHTKHTQHLSLIHI